MKKSQPSFLKLILPAVRQLPILISTGIILCSLAYAIARAGQPSASVAPVSSGIMQSHPAPKQTSVPPPAPPPPPAPVAPPPAPIAAPPPPAPKPAADVTQSPAAVASSQTAPGDGVSGLTPTSGTPSGGSPTPPPPSDPGSGGTTTATPCNNTPARYLSTNWSGYFRSSCNFTAISAKWTVPTPTTTSTTDTTFDAAWIGIGGVSSDDLIQVGTEETVDTDGTINAAVFYELLPDVPHYPFSVTVQPGDHMSASLSETAANLWAITITNLTTGRTFTKTVAYTSSHSSAEWIEEDPSYSDGTMVPFDNFRTVSFTEASATGNGTVGTLSDASSITMVDDQHRVIALPSAITGTNGDGFSVTRKLP